MSDEEKAEVKGYIYPSMPLTPELKAIHEQTRGYAKGKLKQMREQEINEAVARKLGWTQIENDPNEPEDHDGLESGLHGFPPNVSAYLSTIPDYCHDIEAAWEIVEKFPVIKQDGKEYCFTLTQWSSGWTATWVDLSEASSGKYGKELYSCWAKLAPMAICLAFLKLKEDS